MLDPLDIRQQTSAGGLVASSALTTQSCSATRGAQSMWPCRAPVLVASLVLTAATFAGTPQANRAPRSESGLSASATRAPATRDARTAIRTNLDLARESAEAIDAEEGEAPSIEAFRDAEAFVDLLPPMVSPPSVYASGDAEVGFTWSGSGRFLEVAFRGDGGLHWAAAFGDDRLGGFAPVDVRSATRLPKALANLIDRL